MTDIAKSTLPDNVVKEIPTQSDQAERGVEFMDDVRDRNVYILGAGFSAPAGVPVIHDFIDRSRIYFDDPSSSLDKTEREHFKSFLDFKSLQTLGYNRDLFFRQKQMFFVQLQGPLEKLNAATDCFHDSLVRIDP